jgi:hypothetical protein
MQQSEKKFKQSESLSNETTVTAQVERSGTSLDELSEKDFILMENGKEVKDFKMTIEDSSAEQVVDIAFVVDVTRSMGPFIESAKSRLTAFVEESLSGKKYGKKYHTRMCISTFGDYTVRKCDVFYDNDPNDPSTLKQTEELKSELGKLHNATGGPDDPDPNNRDPGNNDKEENPMGALIDASKAPWRADAQRFVILVTDAAFLYSPDKQGVIGDKAPTMVDVNSAIDASQIVVMAVTPSVAGYDSAFQDQPSIIEKSGGEHFLFKSVMNPKSGVSIDTILDRIRSRVNASYKFTYTVDDDSNTNLDPTLPMAERKITLAFKDPKTGEITNVKTMSNFPTGVPKYTTQWTVADKEIDPSDADVTVAGKAMKNGTDYKITGKVIKFTKAPPASSEIIVKYYYVDNFANLRLEPISLKATMKEGDIEVKFNGIVARAADYRLQRDINNNISFTINPSVAKDNYYKIKEHNAILVNIQ